MWNTSRIWQRLSLLIVLLAILIGTASDWAQGGPKPGKSKSDEVEGIVASNDAGVLTILEGAFSIDATTAVVLDKVTGQPVTIAEVQAGDYIEAKGSVPQGANQFVATRVEINPPLVDGTLEGAVSALDAASITLLGTSIVILPETIVIGPVGVGRRAAVGVVVDPSGALQAVFIKAKGKRGGDDGDGNVKGESILTNAPGVTGLAKVELKSRPSRGEEKFEIEVKNTNVVGTIEVWLEDPANPGTLNFVGNMVSKESNERKFERNTRKGQELPYGVSRVTDLASLQIELRRAADAVYTGLTPALTP
jgi:hypothetical protein